MLREGKILPDLLKASVLSTVQLLWIVLVQMPAVVCFQLAYFDYNPKNIINDFTPTPALNTHR
jgi:hypothetical protein